GRLMELLAEEIRPGDASFADQAFMVGIMSLMPALVGLPIRDIVTPLPIADSVKAALCDGHGILAKLLGITVCSESGDLTGLAEQLAQQPELGAKALNRAQTAALAWAGTLASEK
ncbi:MAG TPA: diguanylate phosphodiesterase, partial [Azonexus sp.]|nr:diguanylate phosphodiesterase [Azonexus sp.]